MCTPRPDDGRTVKEAAPHVEPSTERVQQKLWEKKSKSGAGERNPPSYAQVLMSKARTEVGRA